MIDDQLVTLKKLLGVPKILLAAKHNSREMYADGTSENGKLDRSRSHQNYSLAGQTTPKAVVALWKKLRADVGITASKRKDEISAIEWVFSLHPNIQIDREQYFTDCVVWVAKCCGGIGNILSADVHRDQSAPHMHILVLPLLGDKLKGSDMFSGKYPFGPSPEHQKQKKDFHTCVGSKHGLKLPPIEPKPTKAFKAAEAAQVMLALEAMTPEERWTAVKSELEQCLGKYPTRLRVKLGLAVAVKPGKTLKQLAQSKGNGPATEAAEKRSDYKLLKAAKLQSGSLGFQIPTLPVFEAVNPTEAIPVYGFEGLQEASGDPETTNPATSPTQPIRQTIRPPISQTNPQTKSDDNLPEAEEFTRVRESDQNPDHWNPDTGEWVVHAVASVQTKSEKTNAQAWVTGQLTGLMAKRSTRAGACW